MTDKMKEGIEKGFIGNDGRPLRCVCGNTDFYSNHEYRDGYTIVEYDLICDACGTKVGHWAYGCFNSEIIFW